jgi:sugar lactone lactonase YvrE
VTPTPQCADGVDNDGDGQTDLADSDCGDSSDDSEWSLSAGDLVVADTAGRIVRVDPITGSSIVMFGEGLVGPRGLAFDDQGRLLVADSGVLSEFGNGDGALYRYDLDSGSRETLPVPLDNPVDVAVGPDGTIAVTDFSLFDFGGFGAAPSDPELWWFDPIAETATSTPLVTYAPFAVVVDATGDALVATPSISLVSYIPGEVVRVTPGGSETAELSSGIAEDPHGLALDTNGTLLISTYSTGAVGRWDPGTSTETPLATFAPGFWGLDVEADGQIVAVGADATIQRIDPVAGTVTLLASGGDLVFPYGITAVRAACGDGFDNDGDGLVDYPADPGCRDASWAWEDPACDDGLDNDGDGRVDWDGDGMGGDPDPQCNTAFRRSEARRCGLGMELAFGLALAFAWRRSRAGR